MADAAGSLSSSDAVAGAKCAYSNIRNMVHRLNADHAEQSPSLRIDDRKLFGILGICEATWVRWSGKGKKKTTRYPAKKAQAFFDHIQKHFPSDSSVQRINVDDFALQPEEFTKKIDPQSLFLDAFSNICLEGVTRPEVQANLASRYGLKVYYVYSPTVHLNSNNDNPKIICETLLVGEIDEIGLECFLFTSNNFYRGGAYRPYRHEVINLIFARRDTVSQDPTDVGAAELQTGLSFSSRFFLLQDIGGETGKGLPQNRLNGICLTTRSAKPRPHSFPVIIEIAPDLDHLRDRIGDIAAAFRKRHFSQCYGITKQLAREKRIGFLLNDDPRAIQAAKMLQEFNQEGNAAPLIQAFPGDTADEWDS